MRFMFIRRADPATEAGTPPKPGVLAAMEQYHEEMVDVPSREAAMAWAMKWPGLDAGAEVEVRPVYEAEDFAQWQR